MAYNAGQSSVYVNAMGVEVAFIKDYLIWSIINLVCGWGLGLIPLIFSILCRNSKMVNDVSGAQSMSTLALVSNIIISILGGIGWLSFIIVMALVVAAASTIPTGG
jgi:hypothetical protein